MQRLSLSLKNAIYMAAALVAYRVLLDIAYQSFVSQVFSYIGYYYSFDLVKYISSLVVLAVVVTSTPASADRPSSIFLAMYALSVSIPISSLYGLSDRGFLPVAVTVGAQVILRIVVLFGGMSNISYPVVISGEKLAIRIAMIFVGFLVLWYFASGSVRYINFDFSKVYNFREKVGEVSSFGLMGYTNNWTFNFFTIFLISFSLYRRRYIVAFFMICVQIFFFGVSSHKSVLLYPFLALACWAFVRENRSLVFLPVLLSAVVVISLAIYFVLDGILLPSLLLRRAMFTPSSLAYQYIDFFASNPYLYWSNSVLSRFLEYPYDLPVGRLIGFYSGSGASANNGFVSSGFAHAGLAGVFIYTVMFATILAICDSISLQRRLPLWLICACLLPTVRIAISNSDLFTTLLTHGLMVSVLFLLVAAGPKNSHRPQGIGLE